MRNYLSFALPTLLATLLVGCDTTTPATTTNTHTATATTTKAASTPTQTPGPKHVSNANNPRRVGTNF